MHASAPVLCHQPSAACTMDSRTRASSRHAPLFLLILLRCLCDAQACHACMNCGRTWMRRPWLLQTRSTLPWPCEPSVTKGRPAGSRGCSCRPPTPQQRPAGHHNVNIPGRHCQPPSLAIFFGSSDRAAPHTSIHAKCIACQAGCNKAVPLVAAAKASILYHVTPSCRGFVYCLVGLCRTKPWACQQGCGLLGSF
jgi:hypothetical protein